MRLLPCSAFSFYEKFGSQTLSFSHILMSLTSQATIWYHIIYWEYQQQIALARLGWQLMELKEIKNKIYFLSALALKLRLRL